MARPSDNSLKYYNRDTKDDDNLQYVEAVHGLVGYAIVDKLWKHIYGCPGGYYCEFGEINQRLFCKNNGISVADLTKILETCFEAGIEIFSQQMYEQHKILTSTGVQKRWLRIVKEAGRKNSSIREEYRIIEIEVTETLPPKELKSELPADNPPGNHTAAVVSTPITTPETPQSKVKKSKVKQSKTEERAPAAPAPDLPKQEKKRTRQSFVPPTQDEIQRYFLQKMGSRWGESKARTAADACLDHYTANGWVQGKGKPIVDWQAACRQWMRRDLNDDFSSRKPAPKPGATVPLAAQPLPLPPASVKPPEEKLTEEQKEIRIQEFVNDLYTDYLSGTLRFEFVVTNVYDYLKKSGVMKMPPSVTDQIMKDAREKRICELKASKAPDDIRLLAMFEAQSESEKVKNEKGFLKMAKRLAIMEYFAQLKTKQETVVFHFKQKSNVEQKAPAEAQS